jgi:serine/threonine-protein kinase
LKRYDQSMPEEPQPTKSMFDAGAVFSSQSIEEGRFPAGTTLAGRYRILGLLGRGGMGEVYRARDLILNQAVALKFLSHAAHTGEAALGRFRNEVRIARQVSHPNVCRVYDIGVIEGLHFLSMEYVDGEDLASLLRRIGRLPSDKALEFTRRICAGLAAAHERGVLHRDLKPANIMIDGRGQVRITDFGLAALAAEVQIGDIRSGTPAYMSPEQKAGKEVTTRSDLYSLGLVLHEMFTGRRHGESQSSPATLIKDLDPTIERVILRCLDQDPRNRPSSALNVARALPGGDPIAAALAAGETPSPEMVAASGEKEGLQPRTAVACFAGVVVLLVALVLVSSKSTLLGRAPLPLPPDVLAFKAREMLKQFGYTEEPVDSAYGFAAGYARLSYQRYLRAHDFDHRWERLASHQPPLTVFWYFQHQDYLQPIRFLPVEGAFIHGLVTRFDPPLTSKGMVIITLDPKGRLAYLSALPSPALSQAAAGRAVDWSSLLAAAGLDAARFTPSPPEAFLPVYANSRMAWTGSYEEGRPDKIRVEAAALNGRPVFFQILGPWQEPEIAATPPGKRFANIFGAVLFVAVLIAAALVAWRNVRMGRSDKKGAWRIAAAVFAAAAASWALVASHVPTFWELYLLVMGLSWAAFQAGLVGLLYLAVEPFIRKNWPDALISWARIMGGRFRDPLAASHVLAGVCAGMVLSLLRTAALLAAKDLTSEPVTAVTLSGARFNFGVALSGLNQTTFYATGFILVLVLLRSVARRTWVADALFVVLFGFLGPSLESSPVAIPVAVLTNVATIWILRRFGLLAFAAIVYTNGVFHFHLITVASWHAAYSLTTLLIVATVAAWSLYAILASRPGTASRPASESLV